MNLKELGQLAFDTAQEKGFHDTPSTFGDDIALIHSELSEALEAYRTNDNGSFNAMEPLYRSETSGLLTRAREEFVLTEKGEAIRLNKPEGVPSELADALIRIVHVAHKRGIDLTKAVEEKMAYNKTRPYRHGNKKL